MMITATKIHKGKRNMSIDPTLENSYFLKRHDYIFSYAGTGMP
jgi:hypothetical protein